MERAMKRYRFVPPGGGPNYDWTRDHTFVKVSAEDTGGAYRAASASAACRDVLHSGGQRRLHRRRLDDGDAGDDGPYPAGDSAAVVLPAGQAGKMLMIFQPAGFDQYLAELAKMTEQDFADERRMQELDVKYDIINLGGVPARD